MNYRQKITARLNKKAYEEDLVVELEDWQKNFDYIKNSVKYYENIYNKNKNSDSIKARESSEDAITSAYRAAATAFHYFPEEFKADTELMEEYGDEEFVRDAERNDSYNLSEKEELDSFDPERSSSLNRRNKITAKLNKKAVEYGTGMGPLKSNPEPPEAREQVAPDLTLDEIADIALDNLESELSISIDNETRSEIIGLLTGVMVRDYQKYANYNYRNKITAKLNKKADYDEYMFYPIVWDEKMEHQDTDDRGNKFYTKSGTYGETNVEWGDVEEDSFSKLKPILDRLILNKNPYKIYTRGQMGFNYLETEDDVDISEIENVINSIGFNFSNIEKDDEGITIHFNRSTNKDANTNYRKKITARLNKSATLTPEVSKKAEDLVYTVQMMTEQDANDVSSPNYNATYAASVKILSEKVTSLIDELLK